MADPAAFQEATKLIHDLNAKANSLKVGGYKSRSVLLLHFRRAIAVRVHIHTSSPNTSASFCSTYTHTRTHIISACVHTHMHSTRVANRAQMLTSLCGGGLVSHQEYLVSMDQR